MTKKKSPISSVSNSLSRLKDVIKPFTPNIKELSYSSKKRLILDNKKRNNTSGSETDRSLICFYSKDEESIAIAFNYLNFDNETLPEEMRTAEISIKDHNNHIKTSKTFRLDEFIVKIESLSDDIEKLKLEKKAYLNLDNVTALIREHFDLQKIHKKEIDLLIQELNENHSDKVKVFNNDCYRLDKFIKNIQLQKNIVKKAKKKDSKLDHSIEKEKLEDIQLNKEQLESKIWINRNELFVNLLTLNIKYRVPINSIKNILYNIFDKPVKTKVA